MPDMQPPSTDAHRPQLESPILEFVRIGRFLKVTALDPASLIEVVVYGPTSAPEPTLCRLALAKLRRAIERVARRP